MTSSKDNSSDFYEAGFDIKDEAPRQSSAPEEKKDLDSINFLLESVGIAPINSEQTEERRRKMKQTPQKRSRRTTEKQSTLTLK